MAPAAGARAYADALEERKAQSAASGSVRETEGGSKRRGVLRDVEAQAATFNDRVDL